MLFKATFDNVNLLLQNKSAPDPECIASNFGIPKNLLYESISAFLFEDALGCNTALVKVDSTGVLSNLTPKNSLESDSSRIPGAPVIVALVATAPRVALNLNGTGGTQELYKAAPPEEPGSWWDVIDALK